MDASLLLVEIGGETAAIETSCVQSVVELDAVTLVPCLPDHIDGLCALRSTAMTVVDCRRSLQLPPPETELADETPRLAVVVDLDGFLYALVVDAVFEVVPCDDEPSEVRTRLAAGWSRVSIGMVQTPTGPAQLLDPAMLIEGPTPTVKAA